MKKNFIKKIAALSLAVIMLVSSTVYAQLITGNATDESLFYWYEDFESVTEVPSSFSVTNEGAANSLVTLNENQMLEIKKTQADATGVLKYGILTINEFPLDKPFIISYDVYPTALKVFKTTVWLNETDNTFSNDYRAAALVRFHGDGNIYGYTGKADANYSTTPLVDIDYAVDTKVSVTVGMKFDSETNEMVVRQYVNNQLLANEYRADVANADITNNTATFKMKFDMTNGSSTRIDNFLIRQVDSFELPEYAWHSLSAETQYVVWNDTSYYGEGVTLPASMPKSSLTSSDISMIKYNVSDALLLNGTSKTPSVSYKGNGGATISGFDSSDSDGDYYILNIDKDALINYAGKPAEGNSFIILKNGNADSLALVKNVVTDSSGVKVELDTNGKLSASAAKMQISFRPSKAPSQVTVTKEGDTTATYTASVSDDECTVDFTSSPLEEAKTYTVAFDGTDYGSFTTDGELPKVSATIEKFDSSDDIEKLNNRDTEYLTLTLDNERLKYVSTRTSSTGYATYSYENAFDFSKGSMYVSYDVTPNHTPGWVTEANSNLLVPQVYLGEKSIGYTPAFQHYGIYACVSGSRVKTNDASNTMTKGQTVNVGTLFTYYPETNQIGYIQFVNGKRLYKDSDGTLFGETLIDNIDETILANAPSIRLAGRNLTEGLFIDNIAVTTVDAIKAENMINMTGSTAQIEIKNTVEFDEGTDEVITKPLYTNELTKSDLTVTKYNAADTLLINGSEAENFTFDSETFTIGNLDNQYVYVIELSDANKVKSYAGKQIDKTVFKAGTSVSGLIKTFIYDGNGDEIFAASDGKVPSNAAKIALAFEDGYVTGNVALDSSIATLDENGYYVFDLSTAPLASNTEYTVSVNGAEYGKFTTSDGSVTVTNLAINDEGKGTLTITNTTSGLKSVYVISATYKENGELVDVKYEKVDVDKGKTVSYTMTTSPDTTDAKLQKVFAWDGFANMNPYCGFEEKTLS